MPVARIRAGGLHHLLQPGEHIAMLLAGFGGGLIGAGGQGREEVIQRFASGRRDEAVIDAIEKGEESFAEIEVSTLDVESGEV